MRHGTSLPSGPARTLACLLPFTRFLLTSGCLLLFALGLTAACSRGQGPEDEFRIGLLLPLTGTPSLSTAQHAAEALVARVNAEGGLALGDRRLKVRLLVEDTGNQVERVMAATVRLIRQERVSALVGPYYSRDALPAAGVAEQNQVPLISPSASTPALTEGRNYIFRVCLVDTVQGRIMARFALEELGLKRAAVLYDEADAYPSGLANLFCEAFAALGGQVVAREAYSSGTTDFSAPLRRIRASGAQALFLPNFMEDLSRQLPQARAAGFGGVFLGGDSWDTDRRIHALAQAEGAFFSSDFAAQSLHGQLRQEADRYQEQLGTPLDKNAALTLDALGILLAAAKSVGSVDPVSLRAGIASLSGYEGFTGKLTFAGQGDVVRSAHVLIIEGAQTRCRRELAPAQ